MPVRFWQDPDRERYRESSCEVYPGFWRHGAGSPSRDRGSVVIHGRSDSTLNRNGVRMGSADIDNVGDDLPEAAESLALGIEDPDGGCWMPLRVVLADPAVGLDDDLRDRIRDQTRTKASSRHLPDEIHQVPALTHARTGKRLEVPLEPGLRRRRHAVRWWGRRSLGLSHLDRSDASISWRSAGPLPHGGARRTSLGRSDS